MPVPPRRHQRPGPVESAQRRLAGFVRLHARRLLASAAADPALLSSPVAFQDSGAHDKIFGNGGDNWFVLGESSVVES